jgi:hypothetical protein
MKNEKEEILEYLKEIKKECDKKIKVIEAGEITEDDLNGWGAQYSQALQDITYPDL